MLASQLSFRIPVAVLLLALLAIAGLACERPVSPDQVSARLAALEQPHIVLVVIDTLRADWTSPYSDRAGTTPELESWARRGVVFERTRAHSSWTKMSMASMMTSLWPRSHAISEAKDALADSAQTLAELFQQAGYSTHGVQTNGWLDQSFGFQQGFDSYVFPRGSNAKRMTKAQVWPHADKVIEEATRIVEAHDPADPLFLYLHLMDVHEFAAPPEFKTFGDTTEGAYRAAIRWEDDALRRVRELLDSSGLLDNAVVVLASDHGEAFGEHAKYGHAKDSLTATLWTPLVFRFPFSIEPSVRVQTQVRNIDIAPTLLELAGLDAPGSFEGRSLVPLILDPDSEEDRVSYGALGTPLFKDASIQVSMNDGRWTYARNIEPDPHPGEFLFDQSVDPGEDVNLVDLEPERLLEMRKRMDEHLAVGAADGVLETDVRIDPAIADRLRAMGYLK